jgi:hypothetical protein
MSETAPSKHPVDSNPAWQVKFDLGGRGASARPDGRIRRPACLLPYGSAAPGSLGDTRGGVRLAGRPLPEPTAAGEARASSGTPCVRRRYVRALRSRLVLRAEPDDRADWLSWM